MLLEVPGSQHASESVVEGDEPSADRSGTGASVSLEYVAVDGDLAFGDGAQVDHGPQ